MKNANSKRRRRCRRRARSQPVATIRFAGPLIHVSPACDELAIFCTELLVPRIQQPRVLQPLFGLNREYYRAEDDEQAAEHTIGMWLPAGLFAPVRRVLQNGGYCVHTRDQPVDLKPPCSSALRRTSPRDPSVVDFVRTHSRGIVRVGARVDVAQLCVQIARAWPDLKIAVVGSLRKTVGRTAALLRHELGDTQVTHLTCDVRPERIARVTVSTFTAQGYGNLDERDLVLSLDPVAMLGDRSIDCLLCARKARMIGFMPVGREMSRHDSDWIRAWFGFEELTIPQHGTVGRTVVVTRSKVRGGFRIGAGSDIVALKRSGIWRNQLRNRRLSGLVRLLQQRDFKGLKKRFPVVARAINGLRMRSVVVLVENVEHASVLNALLPASSVVTANSAPNECDSEASAVKVQIATETAFLRLDLRQVDVVVRGDGGPGSLAGRHDFGRDLSVTGNRMSVLHVVDFVDETHPELRKWGKRRVAAYTAAGFVLDGPECSPVGRFLSQRPTNGVTR